MRTVMLGAVVLLLVGCGVRAGDYEPALQAGAEKGSNWSADLTACHAGASGEGRAGYGASMDLCMQQAGYLIDLEASAQKFAALEAERKKREKEKAEKLRGY